jgi:zinc protease
VRRNSHDIGKWAKGREERRPKSRAGALLAALALAAALAMPCPTARAQTPAWTGPDASLQSPPAVPPPKPYVLPAPAFRTLANGMKVVVIERHSLPMVTLRLVVEAGAEADPAGAPGTAQLVTALLNQGTAHRTALEIAGAVDRAGGTIDTGADWDSSYAALSVLSDHTELAFDLLSATIRHPGFAPAEVERKRRQTISALEVAHQDPGYIADTAFDHLVLEGTPYGHPQDGTLESVRRLTPADLRAFHERWYRPGRSILAVVGDITPDEAFRLAEKFFGDWENQAAPHAAPTAASRASAGAEQNEIVAINKPDAVQTEIRVGNYGIPRASPDYIALTVANQVLGGPAANRLFSALRTRRGLTYGASSELNCFESAGTWEAKTFTRTSETAQALKVILDQMRNFHDHEITPSELQTTQSYLVGHLALEFQSSESVAEQVLDLMVHGLPLDYWNSFPEKVNALGVEDVRAAVGRHLDPDRAVIVLVGDVAAFRKDLKKFGRARIIPLSAVDFGAAGLERASQPAGRP